MELPQVIILSTQRSGTHLLQSFLTKHPQICGRGEVFLRYRQTGKLEQNTEGKMNVAILMYTEIPMFLRLIENEDQHAEIKIIHLVRNAEKVALSLLQMEADKKIAGSAYQAHFHQKDLTDLSKQELIAKRGVPNLSELKTTADQVRIKQLACTDMLKDTHHLHLNYEEMVPDNGNVEHLNEQTQQKLLSFLELDNREVNLYTTYVKVGNK